MTKRRPAIVLEELGFTSLPGNLLSPVFDQVAYRKDAKEIEVSFHILLPPGEEWNTIVALDTSASMRPLFGRALTGDIPLAEQERYHRQNWVTEKTLEGVVTRLYEPEAYDDALTKGYLKWTENIAEPRAREFLSYLANQVDARDASTFLFFGCENSIGWADLGEVKAEMSSDAPISSADDFSFGEESRLLPLLQYMVAKCVDVPRTIVVVLTDGRFSDLADVKSYSENLALLIHARQRHFMKFVAIGLGKDVDQDALAELDGMSTGNNTELWDTILETDVQAPREIFTGIVSEEQIVAPQALIFDGSGQVVKEFPDGLPVKASFRMPLGSTSFSLQIPPQEKKYKQSLLMPFRKNLL
jgi:hypothetical protein